MAKPMSKLQKAIGAVKDQTSISLAKVNARSGASCRVAIVKATSHDEVPIREREVEVILQLARSSRAHALASAVALGRRITRTRSWAVALKSLLLLLRFFQDGHPHFPKEVLSVMRQRPSAALSAFSASSWHFTAFVRTFALYLDERLHCFLTGKLIRRRSSRTSTEVMVMKPQVLLDRLSHWQRLLDRAIGIRPTGTAKSNLLVHSCLYSVVLESFDLYRDISDGLALLLDSFFHLQHPSCAHAYQACLEASRQFSELAAFYEFCKVEGVGGERTSDYPSVTGMSEDLLDTLGDFVNHQKLKAAPPQATAFHGRGTSLEDLIGDVLVSTSDAYLSDSHSIDDDDDDYEGDNSISRYGWEMALLDDATKQLTTSQPDQTSINVINDDASYNPFLSLDDDSSNGNANSGEYPIHDHLSPNSTSYPSPSTHLSSQVDPNNSDVLNSQSITNESGQTCSMFDQFASLSIGSTHPVDRM